MPFPSRSRVSVSGVLWPPMADDGDGVAARLWRRQADVARAPAGVTDDHPWERRARTDASRYDGIVWDTAWPDGTRSGRTKVLPLIPPSLPLPDWTAPTAPGRPVSGDGRHRVMGPLPGRPIPVPAVAGQRPTRSATLLDHPAGATRPVPSTVSTPIRSHVQALAARALATAIERGDAAGPAREAEPRRRGRSTRQPRPRRPREQPGAQAGATAAPAADGHRRGDRRRHPEPATAAPRSRRSRSRAPGFLNMRLAAGSWRPPRRCARRRRASAA